MSFIILIFLTAILMEAIGTYISVFGLGALFAGDPVIITMAIILDVTKLVTVSFLYQYWEHIKPVFKYYLLSAVLILMTITSAGSFGYLSSAFQRAVQPVMEIALKIDSYKHERETLTAEKDELIKQRTDIDKQIAQLPHEYVKGRQKLIASFKPEEDSIRSRLGVITKRTDELSTQILQVQNENIDKEVHAGPIVYVAKAFDISIEQASKWVIFIIIFVFDPLAVSNILAGNFLIKRRRGSTQAESDFPLQTKVKQDNVEIIEGPKTQEQALYIDAEQAKGSLISTDSNENSCLSPVIESYSDIVPNGYWEKLTDAIETWPILPDDNLMDSEPPLTTPEPFTDEERELLSKVYDDIDTGEEPEIMSDSVVDPLALSIAIKSYVPANPMQINITGDTSYSGSQQVDLIEDLPLRSSLEDLKINLPNALLQLEHSTNSSKKTLYE